MTTRELVSTLINQGYKVTYRVRKDGGILITSIDGHKFKGAEGNKVARWMTGEVLSERRAMQLTKITKTRTRKRVPTPESLESQRKRVTRKWRKAELKGSIGKSNLEAIIRDRGVEGAREYLDNMEKRAEGYTSSGFIEALISRLEQDLNSCDDDEASDIQEMIDYIEAHKDTFPFKNFFEIFDQIYEWEKGAITSSELKNRFYRLVP